MSTKEIFIETVKAKLEAWKDDVVCLQANAERIDYKDIGAYTATIKKILAKIQQIENQFTDDKQLRSTNWQELRRYTETAFADLEPLVKDTKRKYLP